MNFVHLHVHSEYSMLDGACRVRELPKAAKEMGQTAIAVTDHGNMFAAPSFFKACRKEGVKPIIGCEVYVAPGGRKSRAPEDRNQHLILLVKDEQGYRNLCRLVSAGWTEGFYGKPRVDDELLARCHEGLIALSGCLMGRIPQLILSGDAEGAAAEARRYEAIFGKGNYYLEIQDHFIKEEKTVREGLIALCRETGVPPVATNDAHYIRKSDADVQAMLMCIKTGRLLSEGRPFGFENDEFYLKSADEMATLFSDVPEAIENTVKIAEKCDFSFDFSKRHLPTYPVPEGTTPAAYLQKLAEEGLKQKKENGALCLDGHTFEDYKFRMIYELMMISKMGYADYYLIVWDFVRYARSVGIPVGPGRGSGAGSLVAYLIGITEVDSIRYDLLFERFLNPERVSMPDFDVDFADDRRDEVVDYVAEKYGRDHVSQIAAFGTLGARAAVRDAGRVLGVSYAETDAVAKLIPHTPDMTVEKALQGKELRAMYENSLTVRQLLDAARAVEGMPRNVTRHAAGVVITEKPVVDYLPLTVSSGAVMTQYDMDTVADLGLLKFDFLALRYLTVIDRACRMIRKQDPSFEIEKQPLDDEDSFRLIASGETDGLFQLESAGMKRLLVQMKPRTIDDLMIAIALYRPGPMDSIPTLLRARAGERPPEYRIPALKEILDGTSGCIVYQEQVMQIFRKVAGYSYGRADVIRRAMSKKHADELEAERKNFLDGAEKNLVDREAASELFDSMASFASYAFNKSHAAAYAFTSYRTAFLKAHYPAEYMSALLTSVAGDLKKTADYIAALEKRKIAALPPDVNESGIDFTAADGGVRFGLVGIKNVGVGFAEALIENRKSDGPFRSLEDFVARMNGAGLNKQVLLSLIGAGAFDRFGVYRSRMTEGLDELLSFVNERLRRNADGQTDLFSMSDMPEAGQTFVYPGIVEYPLMQRLSLEKELTGLWFSGHPLGNYQKNIDALHADAIGDILDSFDESGQSVGIYKDGQNVHFCGVISSLNLRSSKAGKRFALLAVEDARGQIGVLVFENLLDSVRDFLKKDAAVYVKGRLRAREEEPPTVAASDVLPLLTDSMFAEMQGGAAEAEKAVEPENASGAPNGAEGAAGGRAAGKPKRLYIKLTQDEKKDRRLTALTAIFTGETPCLLFDPATGRYTPAGGVRVSEYLLSVLRSIAGEDHVVFR